MKAEAVVVLAVFMLAVLYGALLPPDYKSSVTSSTKEILAPVSDFVKKNPIKTFFSLPFIIFYNNLRVAIVNLLLGVTLLAPLGIAWFNGFIMGSIATYGDVTRNIILLLPHGVIELTAILYSAALGLKIGVELVKKALFKRGEPLEAFKYALSKFKLIFILLLTAAVVESYITPLIYFLYTLITGSKI